MTAAVARGVERARRVRPPAVLPGLLVLVTGLALAPFDGAFAETLWYPTALFLLALLVLVVVAAPPSTGERSRLTELALGAYALYCALAFLSIAWAGMPDLAWDGANKILLYGIVVGLVCLRPWSPHAATWALALVAFGTAAVAAGVLVTGVYGSDPARLFVQGRLAAPVGYLNASVSLWLIGFFPAVHLATARTLAWPLRGLALAAATLLLQVALLSQSRGAAIAFVATAVLYLLLTPRRWSALGALAAPVVLTVLASSPLLDVRGAASASEFEEALVAGAGAVALSAVGALLAGAAAAFVGSRSRTSAWLSARPAVARGGNVALVGLAVCAMSAVLVAIGDPAAWADDRWRDFKGSGYTLVDEGRTRFGGSLGSGRYDFYRVALDEFKDHPVLGIGAGNFGAEYLLQRRTGEAPAHPHSLVFRALSQLGVVGALLLGAFLTLMIAAALRVRRRASSDDGAVMVAALMTATVWLVHAAGDWLWEFPSLAMLALAMLGIAARLRPAQPVDGATVQPLERPSRASSPAARTTGRLAGSIAARTGLASVVLVAAISLAIPGVAARYASAGYDVSGTNPQLALNRLERAADLNPLNSESLIAEGVLAQRLGRRELAAEAFRRAVDRAPKSWFAHFELGLVTALRGDVGAAKPSLREAIRLNPRQPVVREALATVQRGEAVDPRFAEERLAAQLESKFDATDPDEAADSDD